MALTLMYITNNPEIAAIAQDAKVDRLWVDMEYIGKDERQSGLDTVKSYHTIADVENIRKVAQTSKLQVRVNPIHQNSKKEINDTVLAGADYIMLPYFKTVYEVEKFIEIVAGRAKTMILVETKEAAENIQKFVEISGVDEVHIGLNDLHLAYKQKFMFELLANGTVEQLCKTIAPYGKKYGFGGIARVGYGMLPAEYIIAEHYRLGSEMAILSRGFCDANLVKDPNEIRQVFIDGVENIRRREKEVKLFSQKQFFDNQMIVQEKVEKIVELIKDKEK